MKRLTTLMDFLADHTFGGSTERPFNGQPHTFAGERGKRHLPPLRYRDLADAMVRGWAEQMAAGVAIDPFSVDPDALALSICLWVEALAEKPRS